LSFIIFRIGIRTVFEKQLCNQQVRADRRVHKRVPPLPPGIKIGTSLYQCLCGHEIAADRRKMQWRPAAIADGIDVRAMIQEELRVHFYH
jgi:hypothetical protein